MWPKAKAKSTNTAGKSWNKIWKMKEKLRTDQQISWQRQPKNNLKSWETKIKLCKKISFIAQTLGAFILKTKFDPIK